MYNKAEGKFENGDLWHGGKFQDFHGDWWYLATDTKGMEYETIEEPYIFPMFTMTQFAGAWNSDEVNKYFDK